MKCILQGKWDSCGLNINGVWDFLADLKEKLASTVQGKPPQASNFSGNFHHQTGLWGEF